MTRRVQELLENASQLTREERDELLTALIALVDGPADSAGDVQAAWGSEIERRADRADRGESRVTSWEDARDRLRRGQA
jgi:hypothetical protein